MKVVGILANKNKYKIIYNGLLKNKIAKLQGYSNKDNIYDNKTKEEEIKFQRFILNTKRIQGHLIDLIYLLVKLISVM